MYIFLLLFVLLIVSTISFKDIKIISYAHIAGMLLLLAMVFQTLIMVNKTEVIFLGNEFFMIDSLSAIQMIIISVVSFISILYSHNYIQDQLEDDAIKPEKAKLYYMLIDLFIFSMYFVSASNNIAGMWIGLEGTTLSIAFLIGFRRDKLSLEAAWKYIIICSLGIGLGLVGIVLFIYSVGMGAELEVLNWTYIIKNYQVFDRDIVKIAFAFIFIGIGTKAGIAPMHTWMPDGYSEAPSPVAMISGILLNVALYVIVRFYIIMRFIYGMDNVRYLFIIFACFSLLVAAFSMLKQGNFKRLLAFSSIENIGIITLGLGVGAYISVLGALIHSIIHSFAKTLLFITAGNMQRGLKTNRVDKIEALIKIMPKNAIVMIIGMLILTGAPPFAAFFSEFYILAGAIQRGHYVSGVLLAICILVAFAAFLNILFKMIFKLDKDVEYKPLKDDSKNMLGIVVTFTFIIIISLMWSNLFYPILSKATMIICGVQ